MGNAIASLFGPSQASASQATETEVISARGRHEKLFRDTEGGFRAVFARDLHFQDDEGQWQDVDLRFARRGDDDVVDRAEVITRVTGRGVAAVDRRTGIGIRWRTPSRPATSGRRASFVGQGGLTWVYHARPHGVKLTAGVAAALGPRLYTFPYDLIGLTTPLTLRDDGSMANETVRVPPPVVEAADHRTLPVGGWQVTGPDEIGFTLDDTAYPAAAFPYEIDPTATFGTDGSTDDGFAHGTGSSWSNLACNSTDEWNDTANYFRTSRRWEYSKYNLDKGVARWSTSSLPANATITAARLKVNVYGVDNQDSGFNRKLIADWYTGSYGCPVWSTSSGTNASGAGWALATMQTGVSTFTLTNASTYINDAGTSGIRTHLTGTDAPTGINQVLLSSWDSPTYIPPTLEVD